MMEWYVVAIGILFCGLRNVAADYPDQGCFWTGNCVSGWAGGCGEGRVVVAKSQNCAGLCSPPQYQPCPLFTTHFQCCNYNKPVVSQVCPRCERRVDFGKAYLCCEDCSEPVIADKDTGEGFCTNGAQLAITLKPLEVYKTIPGEWGNCSSSCGGGLRVRQLACHRVDPSSGHPIGPPVGDELCQDVAPPTQEACHLHPCPKAAPQPQQSKPKPEAKAAQAQQEEKKSHHGGMSGWLVALLSFLCVTLVGGAAVGGYLYYQRTKSSDQGFVYVMLEGYN